MSSSIYSTELRTESGLRRAVAVTAALWLLLGALALLSLPLNLSFRLLLVSAWLGAGGWEYHRTTTAWARWKAVLLDADGGLRLIAADGRTVPAKLSRGCVVLATAAWLRVETPDGVRFAELLRGRCRESEEWRRFQVIWRHLGRAARSC